MNKLLMIIILGLLLIIPLVTSAPPTFQTFIGDTGLDIQFQHLIYHRADTNYTFAFTVYNLSSGVAADNDSISCLFHLHGPDGVHLSSNKTIKYNTVELAYVTVPIDSFTDLGTYNYLIQCNNTAENYGGFVVDFFEVTPSGKVISTGTAIVYFIGLSILLILLILCIIFWADPKKDNPAVRLSLFYGIYVLTLCIMFILWNLCRDYVINQFLARFAFWFFLVLLIGMFPMVIGTFVWLIYYSINLKKMQEIIRRGGKPW